MDKEYTLKDYVNFVLEHNKTMPKSENDVLRIAGLHSWYKHLSGFEKAYPLLMYGEEPRNSFDPQFTDENESNFHWTIIMESNIDGYNIKIKNDYVEIPKQVKEYMKKFPIYLNNHFSSCDDRPLEKFLLRMCNEMCKEFWNEMNKIK